MAQFRLVVGLGNPGSRYQNTRHNVGFEVLDRVVARNGGRFKVEPTFEVAEVGIGEEKVILAKPMTFMNRSGEPAKQLADYFGFNLQDLVVVHDEIDLPLGQLRVSKGGGEGGHNGLRSVSHSFGARDYVRVRAGVGRPLDPRWEIADWVLSRFASEELTLASQLVEIAADAVEVLIDQGLKSAQNRYNAPI